MKILIADDELYARTRLCDLVKELPRCEVVGCASSGVEAIEKVLKTHPNIVLLDICMPDMDGIEVANCLECLPHPPQIIFTTAYAEHAFEAFSTKAFGYLLKPIMRKPLLERILHAEKSSPLMVSEPQNYRGMRQYVACRSGEKIEIINARKIIFMKADTKYTVVKHTKGENVLTEALVHLEKEFKGQFIRIHRSTLVNADYIRSIEKITKNKSILSLKGCPEMLAVSRRHYFTVREYLSGNYTLGMRHDINRINRMPFKY